MARLSPLVSENVRPWLGEKDYEILRPAGRTRCGKKSTKMRGGQTSQFQKKLGVGDEPGLSSARREKGEGQQETFCSTRAGKESKGEESKTCRFTMTIKRELRKKKNWEGEGERSMVGVSCHEQAKKTRRGPDKR